MCVQQHQPTTATMSETPELTNGKNATASALMVQKLSVKMDNLYQEMYKPSLRMARNTAAVARLGAFRWTHADSTRSFVKLHNRFAVIFAMITILNIVSMVAYTYQHTARLRNKEWKENCLGGGCGGGGENKSTENHHQQAPSHDSIYNSAHYAYPLSNRNAYAVHTFLRITSLTINIMVRLGGLLAIGFFGGVLCRNLSYNNKRGSSSNSNEDHINPEVIVSDLISFMGCLSFIGAMIVLFAGYPIGLMLYPLHDLCMHVVLILLGIVFITMSMYGLPVDTMV